MYNIFLSMVMETGGFQWKAARSRRKPRMHDKTTDYLSEAKDSVTENVGDFVDEAKDNLSKVKDKAKEGINAAGEAVQKAYEKAKK
ncbi:MAG: hypothetical protein ACLR0N_08645 [Bilophila wadsworthia]